MKLEERAALTRRMAARFRARARRTTAERFERQANGAVEQGIGKIEDPQTPERLVTVRGAGYMLADV